MKRFIIIIFFALISFALFSPWRAKAQNVIKANPAPKTSAKPDSPHSLNTRNQASGKGLYIGGGFNLGIGLNEVNVPYGERFFGLTATAGHAWNSSFLTGIGAGYSAYNEGSHFPLFADVRYIFGRTRTKPLLDLQTGFLLKNDKDSGHPRYFVNPTVGLVSPVNGKLFFTVSAGLFTQWLMHDGRRDSFANLKLGILFR